jgi:hypothetical protein
LQITPHNEERDEHNTGRCTLLEGVSLQDIQLHLGFPEKFPKGRLLFTNQNIILYEVSTYEHELPTVALNAQLYNQFAPTCKVSHSTRFTSVRGGWSKEPDGSICPRTKPALGINSDERATDPWPNVVIEVCKCITCQPTPTNN